MRLATKSQPGFALIETFLIIVLICIVGGTGYYVIQAQQKSNKVFSAVSQSALSSPEHRIKSNTKSEDDTKPTLDFTIKELGVAFKLPASLKGFSYRMETVTNEAGNPEQAAYLNDTSLASLLNACAVAEHQPANATTGNFAALNRIEGQYNAKKEVGEEAGLLKQFKNFHILYSVPNGAICSPDDQKLNQQFFTALHATQTTFHNAFAASATPL